MTLKILLKYQNWSFRTECLVSLRAFPLSDCRGQWISIIQSFQQCQLQAPWKNILVKYIMFTCASQVWEKQLKGYLITLIHFMAECECQRTAEFSILPVWHTEWAFQRQTWEENVCYCTVQQWSQGAQFHQNTACSDCGRTKKEKKKKWVRWQTKIDIAFHCVPSSPHPPVFNFQSSTRMEEVTKRGRSDGKWRKRHNKGWKLSSGLGRNRRALKAIYRPQGAGGGVGLGQGTVRQTLG